MQDIAIKRYRKRPVVVEAVLATQWNLQRVAEWCNGWVVPDWGGSEYLRIPTREGVMTAEIGDFVIKGAANEFYPCKGDVFDQIYEEVGDDD